MTNPVRYTEVQDQSSHRYLVPVSRLPEWWRFMDLPEDDERSWKVPSFATAVDGGMLTFTDPRIE